MGTVARASRRCLVPFLVSLLLPIAAGCSGDESAAPTTQRAATTSPPTTSDATTSTTSAATTTTSVQQGPRTVDLRVVSGPGGVFAFLQVYIRGEGPFAFTVDTGASNSVIDFDVVRKLRLKTIGDPVTITGIACRGEAGRLRIAKWRADRIRLPSGEIQTIDMPEVGGGIEIDGLLGSDVLSSFGAITVDYETERLLLGV
jgi:predicted aspartyl protease